MYWSCAAQSAVRVGSSTMPAGNPFIARCVFSSAIVCPAVAARAPALHVASVARVAPAHTPITAARLIEPRNPEYSEMLRGRANLREPHGQRSLTFVDDYAAVASAGDRRRGGDRDHPRSRAHGA